MAVKNITIYLPFLKGVWVTGKDDPPAVEGIATGFSDFIFPGKDKIKLTGMVTLIVNTKTLEVVPATGSLPAVWLDVDGPYEGMTYPHRIQLIKEKRKKARTRK